MIDKYKEKFGFLTCVDSNDNPVGIVEFDQFPMNYSFPLKALFFNFKVNFPYQVTTQVLNSNDELLVNTKNSLALSSDILTDEKYTNNDKSQASSIVQIKTPPINVIKNDMYKISLTVSKDDVELDSASTYIIISKVVKS